MVTSNHRTERNFKIDKLLSFVFKIVVSRLSNVIATIS